MKKNILFSLLAILATALWGCSSDKDEIGSDNSDITIVSEAEMDNDVVNFSVRNCLNMPVRPLLVSLLAQMKISAWS